MINKIKYFKSPIFIVASMTDLVAFKIYQKLLS